MMMLAAGRFRKQYVRSPVVKESQFDEFNARCEAALEKYGFDRSESPSYVFGSKQLGELGRSTYLSKIRKFVSWVLELPAGQHDDSLLIVYSHTPGGSVSMRDTAISHFLLTKFGEKGQVLKDLNVSERNLQPFICNLL